MKKYLKIILIIIFILIVSIITFRISRKMSLNNYLSNTKNYSDKINYSTIINLSISDKNNSSTIDYEIDRFSYIRKILLKNYKDGELVNSISKYLVLNGKKKGSYVYNGKTYNKTSEIKEDFVVDYSFIKDKIRSIENIKNVVIDGINYKKYIVKIKSYDAYNIIYKDEILNKNDLDSIIQMNIYVDKSNSFVYKIEYTIDNLNNSNIDNNSLNYDVQIMNININNNDEIKLPF